MLEIPRINRMGEDVIIVMLPLCICETSHKFLCDEVKEKNSLKGDAF